MLLKINEKGSSGRHTRHINLRYFFICDKIAAGEVSMKVCPTGKMIVEFFAKPLYGDNLLRFSAQILNLDTKHG